MGDHFYNKRTLTRRMDSVVADVSSQRIAVLQMGQSLTSKSKRGVKVGGIRELSLSLGLRLFPLFDQGM